MRYRLRLDLGNVRTLAQSNGSFTNQLVVAGDMHLLKVSVPQSNVTQANSTPLDWNVFFNQIQGDGIVSSRGRAARV